MSEPAIRVQNLNIYYKEIHQFSLKRLLSGSMPKTPQYFHAIRNLSFELEEGEILGIIGTNGSGKSTLLNTIAGIYAPDSGTIDLGNRSVALLSIGVGFEKSLTGRENIMLNGLLLGFREKEVREKMQEIIDFSELGPFIDKPVRTYSKGMYSKLAFSITSCLESDILLIDEVLSVGDEHFKEKSFQKMQSLISDGRHTVVIVSHSMSTLRHLCTKVLWIQNGEFRMMGAPRPVIRAYREACKEL